MKLRVVISFLLYLNIFRNLSQLEEKNLHFKIVKIHKRDFSKFESDLFRDDVSIQNWNLSFDNVNDQFNYFFWKITGCVDRHAPIKELTPKEIKLKISHASTLI